MEDVTITSLVTSAASLTTIFAAVAFSQVSSDRRVAQVSLGIFTILSASFSVTSSLGLIGSCIEKYNKGSSDSSDEGENGLSWYAGQVTEHLYVGAAFTLFGLSILAVTHAAERALKKLSNP